MMFTAKKLDIVLKNAKTLLSLCLISKSWQKTIINITNYETFKSNVTVGCHLVNLALEEVSVEFHPTILTFGRMSKLSKLQCYVQKNVHIFW